MARILIVDDQPEVVDVLYKLLNMTRCAQIRTAHSGQAALTLLTSTAIDVALIDLFMPDMNGLELVQICRRKHIHTDLVIITGDPSYPLAVEAIKKGATDFMTKPLEPQHVIHTVKALLKKRRSVARHLAEQIDAALKDRASEPSLCLEEVCHEFSISQRHVSRIFQQKIGMGFKQRLAYHRVQKAKALLEQDELPLYLIAEEVGFKAQSRLTETFKRFENVGPNVYRMQSKRSE